MLTGRNQWETLSRLGEDRRPSLNTGPPAPAAFAASDPTGPSVADAGQQRWWTERSRSKRRKDGPVRRT